MNFRIADTFTDSLAKLTGDEQKAVKTTAFDLQLNPANPGMQFHKLDRAKDKNFWSVRVNAGIRLIVHRTDTSLLLCYVDHHDKAYHWAERRKIEVHPRTGALQLVEVRERVQEITIPQYVEATPSPAAARRLFDGVADDDLLGYGVPAEWLDDVREATEDSIFDLADHLPREAAEALLELATGGTPARPVVATAESDPFEHPDTRRRFRLMANVEELRRALAYSWEKWIVFLHPSQREIVERRYNGPARVYGSAGTGKTVVALHRAAHLARENPVVRVLLTTFSEVLAAGLRRKLRCLLGSDEKILKRIEVRAIDGVDLDLYAKCFGKPTLATDAQLLNFIRDASNRCGEHRFSDRFLLSEWREVVDGWQLNTWEAYRVVARLGRKTRLGEKQRQVLWSIFEQVKSRLREQGLQTLPGIFANVTNAMAERDAPYDFAVIDEAQDIGVVHLRFLAALAGSREGGLFFAGDLGQRIFQTPFSWMSLGVDVRGRSHTLRINYRTSHQIRKQADRLLPTELADVDGNVESRKGTVSAFNGPEPIIQVANSAEEERDVVAAWLRARVAEGVPLNEIGVFVRSPCEIKRAFDGVTAAGLTAMELDGRDASVDDAIAVGTMHLAKGLEFRAVAVAACDDEVVPLQSRIEAVSDDADLEEIYNTERHLLYVACTRARDHLLVTAVEPGSEFLDDLRHLDGGRRA